MVLERYMLKHFSNPPKEVYEILRPEMAEFTGKLLLLHDGIHAVYNVPELILAESRMITDKYVILEPKQSIPANGKLIDIIPVIFERDVSDESQPEATQGMIILPIYKLE